MVFIQGVAAAFVSDAAANGIPDAAFTGVQRDNDQFVTKAQIWIPTNITTTAGLYENGGCERIQNLLAHEFGHGFFGSGHYPGVMRGYVPSEPYGGLDSLPGIAPCDRDQELFGRSYTAPSGIGAGGVVSCQPGAFHDNHGCPCTNAFYVPPSMWASYNHKPYGHIQWPYAGVHSPFSGTLQMHTTDVDGEIWFVDYFVNGTYLTRSYGADSGFTFNAAPGAYYIEQAIYDNTGEYAMGTPKQVNVCGGPPPQVSPVYHEVSSGYVNVYWQNPQPGFVGAYLVEGGTYPGGVNVGSWNVGNTAAWAGLWVGPVGSGTYYVRVKAWNPCGFAVASPDITIVVP